METDQPNQASSIDRGISLIAQAWANREGPAVFATVDAGKMPNAIYVGEIRHVPGEGFVVTDNYFHKTRANLKGGTKGAILFLTKEHKSYQVKGSLTYHTEGRVFDAMRACHDPKHPGVAATLLRVEEAYSGSEKLL
jgi:predicted pyridoxine 5'-phosphate oxidase superfamily flavin-nucleotide-binding protein